MLRRRPASPEHAELLNDLAVSSSAEPLSPRALFPSVAAVTTAAESFSPPAMAWPWPQPPQLAPEPTVVLTATSGARSTHQFLPERTIASNRSAPELRRHRELVSGELRPPQPLPLAQLDAAHLQLPVGANHASNGAP